MVTEPTEFYGDTFSRLRDPWSNLWWVYRHSGTTGIGDQEEADWTDDDSDSASSETWNQRSPELTYIHDTLLTAMRNLKNS